MPGGGGGNVHMILVVTNWPALKNLYSALFILDKQVHVSRHFDKQCRQDTNDIR